MWVGRFVLVRGKYAHGAGASEAPLREVIAEYWPRKVRHSTVHIYRQDAVPLPLIILTAMAVEEFKDGGY